MNSIIIKKSLKDKKNYISILIIVLSILLITIACSFYKMCSNYYKESSQTLEYRTIYISGLENGWTVYDKSNERIKGIEHVVDYYYDNETRSGVGVETISGIEYEGEILIRGIGENVNINVVDGERQISNYELICPTIFSPASMEQLVENSSLIVNFQLGDEIVGHVKQYDTDLKLVDTKKFNFKIVGKYLEHDLDSGFYVCYGTHDLVTELYEVWTEYEKDFTSDNSAIGLIIDNPKNIDSVIEQLDAMGYKIWRTITYDMSVVLFLYLIVVVVVIVISIVTIIIIIAIYNKNKEHYISEGLLYKTFGYSTKDAVNIYTKELLFIESVGACLSLLILVITQLILSNILNNNPFAFYGMNVSVSFMGYILAILINFIVIAILRHKFSIYLNESSIITELKKNE